MLRWDRQKRHCRALHIERQIPYKQFISFHLNIIVISRQYSFLWCVICQCRFIVQSTMPTEIVENTRKTSLVEHRARRQVRYYLKFHGARTAFCKVIEGKITSAYGARPAFAHIGRAPDELGLKFKSYDFNGDRSGTVRCPVGHRVKRARNFRKSLYKLADGCPGTGRYFMSRTATGEMRRVFAEVHIESV